METEHLLIKCESYIQTLCNEIPDRSVGSDGNRRATDFFRDEVSSHGWKTDLQEFDAMDWVDGGATLRAGGQDLEVFVSPYSNGCNEEGVLIGISSVEELEQAHLEGKIVLIHGEIAKEQLMPKNFVFYNPAEHRHIISLLENGNPRAILCATGRNASLAGGVYPFPLIEDGDFDIPSVYMTEDEGRKLSPFYGDVVSVNSVSTRVPGKGCNVIGHIEKPLRRRIVVTAHIDSKKGTAGAIDNATGVVVLLLLADLLADDDGKATIELAALNGEDYYAVSGQMRYIEENQHNFNNMILNINIDGAGYKDGKSAFSFYDLPSDIEKAANDVIDCFAGITEGPQWPQGDHSIFIQNSVPAVAVSSEWFTANIDNQTITHTPKDNPGIVDCRKVVEIARGIASLINAVSRPALID